MVCLDVYQKHTLDLVRIIWTECLRSILSKSCIVRNAADQLPSDYRPILAGIPFGAGNAGVFIYASNYLVQSYGVYAASALAGNAVLRSVMGATLPLVRYHDGCLPGRIDC